MTEFKTGHYCFMVMQTEYYPNKGYMACVVVENEAGYHRTGKPDTEPWYWGHDLAAAEEVARKKNHDMGLTDDDVMRIIASSMTASNTRG